MSWSWKGFCSLCGAVGCAATCIIASAATIVTAPISMPVILGSSAVAGGLGYLVGDKADQEAAEREKHLMENQRYKDAFDAANNQANQNGQNKQLIEEIIGKLNGSIQRKPHETDEYLNQQLIITQNNLKQGEERLNQLSKEMDKLRKELGGGQSLMTLLGLDKLSFTDKVMITGSIVLIIFLLKR